MSTGLEQLPQQRKSVLYMYLPSSHFSLEYRYYGLSIFFPLSNTGPFTDLINHLKCDKGVNDD